MGYVIEDGRLIEGIEEIRQNYFKSNNLGKLLKNWNALYKTDLITASDTLIYQLTHLLRKTMMAIISMRIINRKLPPPAAIIVITLSVNPPKK